GTLFLDEIGDMPTELQTRLLRVLSDGHFYRVGGHVPIKANVRVIAATHQHLEDRVKRGLFREDLFHRLNVIRLRLPPLRERREDIPLLTRHFLAKSASSLGVEPKRLTDAAMEVIKFHSFTGNVRELENLCQWITVMAPGQQVEVGDLPAELREPEAAPLATASEGSTVASAAVHVVDWTLGLAEEVARRLRAGEVGIIDDLCRRFEESCIRTGLAHTGGRKVEAAHLLGWGRNTLTRKIQELGMEAHDEQA
ncbi:nitrogen regulation protein NR(I), partial [Aquitalea palustris]